ncbi:conserved uncharacterized protein [Stigmatella aurantiaca DW4/3-1]|uniref:Conserved uncharacterized protein n=1 Tax=Stigmatella aurantiaca (strain DW4/3-1) TaxID=378806 RepID=E3FPF9_STIAD|nr:conserved uncharacterized protein [Stigmatella aurantiaca DW4/3-1]
MALWLSACAHGGETPEGIPDGPQATPGLEGARVGKLFECFATLQAKSPGALYWVSSLKEAEGYYVATQFQYLPIRKYGGYEIVIFSKDHAAYYWMPGAQSDATGFVSQGVHQVEAELPGHEGTVHLRLDKRYPNAFVLTGQGAELEGSVQRILPRQLLDWLINEELHELTHDGLNFQSQALRSGVLREQVASWMKDGAVTSACRNISQRVDKALGLLEEALAAPGTPAAR